MKRFVSNINYLHNLYKKEIIELAKPINLLNLLNLHAIDRAEM